MRTALTLILSAALATPVGAVCYADYKAKKDDPLQLHYGVIQIDDANCDVALATPIVAERLADGWQLLEVTSVFGPEGLAEREDSAGEYFLRY